MDRDPNTESKAQRLAELPSLSLLPGRNYMYMLFNPHTPPQLPDKVAP